MQQFDQPPPIDFFERQRPEAGSLSVCVRLGPLQVEISGLDEAMAETLLTRYTPYASGSAAEGPALRVRLSLEDREYFIVPSGVPELTQVRIAGEAGRVRFLSYRVAGWFDDGPGTGELLLARGDYDNEQRALENYLRAAVAWQAAGLGGALVHAASAVWRDRAYLFYGESGAGKSTLSECNRRARIVSDDLSLVLPGEHGGLELIGSPFRGTYEEGEPVVGRFPLAAGFRLIQAPAAEVRAVRRIRAFAELVGNLPFVAEAFPERPDLFERTQRSFASVPLAHLHFCKDETYWDAIEAAGY